MAVVRVALQVYSVRIIIRASRTTLEPDSERISLARFKPWYLRNTEGTRKQPTVREVKLPKLFDNRIQQAELARVLQGWKPLDNIPIDASEDNRHSQARCKPSAAIGKVSRFTSNCAAILDSGK